MTDAKVRVRFAPSPTGYLHVGNARTALLNYMFARRTNGTMILRLEDTDLERSQASFRQKIRDDLKWLGVRWQEGPDVGGDYGPYLQSERLEIYREYSRRLMEQGLVYPCFCTEDELEVERQRQLSEGLMPQYSGRCLHLSEAEKQKLIDSGRRPAMRFRATAPQVSFTDMLLGNLNFMGDVIGDFIIVRSSGAAAYNFAVVVDDILMKVTHVIRGGDHVSNTPRQILLYQALGHKPPMFAHHPLLMGPDRTKLSKRHGATSIDDFRRLGYLPEALSNYLMLLGWEPPNGQEIFHIDEMAPHYHLEDLGKSAAIFDFAKLKWLNGQHIRQKSAAELAEMLAPFAAAAGFAVENKEPDWFVKVTDAIKNHLELLSDAGKYLPIFYADRFQMSPEVKEQLADDAVQKVVGTFYHELSLVDELTKTNMGKVFKAVGQKLGVKGHDLYMPVRAALTGVTEGPELDKVIMILGKEGILKRLAALSLPPAPRD